jgi:hypothetical protein
MPKKTTAKPRKTSTTKKARSSKKTVAKSVPVNDSRTGAYVDYKDLFYGTMSAIAVYVFALWAIDSGNLWVYALSFASVYYTIHFYRLFLRNKFFNNRKAK